MKKWALEVRLAKRDPGLYFSSEIISMSGRTEYQAVKALADGLGCLSLIKIDPTLYEAFCMRHGPRRYETWLIDVLGEDR
jgi:hypothetical protein